MRTIMKLSLFTAFTALTACATTTPPKELVDARAGYTTAAMGPASTEQPAQLHTAKQALDQAENAFVKDGDDPITRDKAYIALRKAQLADATARVSMANKAKNGADAEAQRLTSERLQSTKQNLSKTQDQLQKEQAMRAEAEKRAAMAMADLQKIAAVKQEPRGVVITLSGSVLFATNESTLLPQAQTKLNDVADALIKSNPDANITVEGHSDSQGAHDYNMQLSQRRADAVKAQLVARGVAADRIQAVGIGPDRPVADNKSAEGRANNRRVEIIVGDPRGARAGEGSSQNQGGSTTMH